ncbi:serine/threonine-protein kinase PknD [Mycobacterium sp. 1274756.6]|uniref:serine/threonine-protein kinase PknD n=1 Tax=Mycobacterium sp. 1274756.6 TaxID=1834076 RepID=UPI00080227A0|nr:serine/threonine-protein kinase PknD [Mycobacterium sp. 1274756.6]OBJ70265.1 serine/threonine protein kinase [Mycobacterium sp. 1274756.6]
MDDTGGGSRAGTQFGPYQLRRLLGRGGMGEVYEAEDTRKRRVVALKLISQQFSGNPVFRARLQREADTAGRLTEPHVVPIHDYGEIDGLFFVDMRLINGIDLRTRLRRYGPLSPARAVAVVRQIAAALDAAHAAGITHRDVKPENILVTDDDFAYLVDFGLARAAADPSLTQTGTAMGTYNYMAPERFTGNEVTYRSDIYSLACVMDEALTGSPPYPTESIERLVAAHLMEPAPRPSTQRPGAIPPALDHVIARGMAKRPEDRYPTAGDLAIAALGALTAPEQDQAAAILEQDAAPSGPAPTMAAPVASGAATMAQPFPSVPSAPQPAPRGAAPAAQRGASRGASPATPPDVPPQFARTERRRSRRWVALAAVAAVIVVAGVVITGFVLTRRPSSSPGADWTSATGQSVLPFNGLTFRLSPGGVALDGDGNVYVTNQGMYGRVVKLGPGSSSPAELPFTGLYEPQGIAVDKSGAVYVADFNNRVVKLDAGSTDQKELPFTGLTYPEGLAVDDAGDVFVADRGNDRVLKLPAGSDTQTVLPFTGLQNPDGVAVDKSGAVYVTDSDNDRVLKLPAGSDAQAELPFTGLAVPWGIAVDDSGAVYVTEHDAHKVVKLAAGSNAPTELPITGLNTPLDVAVDHAGNVFVADRGNDRVVRLSAH